MTRTLPSYLQYWGKAQPAEGAAYAWHPLVYHCLDVAAVAEELLRRRRGALQTGARLLHLSPDQVLQLIPAFVALHDIGKCTYGFQNVVPPLAVRLQRPVQPRSVPHTVVGYLLWDAYLADCIVPLLTQRPAHELLPLAEATFGHHGQPVSPERREYARQEIDALTTLDVRGDAIQMAQDMVRQFWNAEPVATGHRSSNQLASWWLAGLVTIADWTGSSQHWFPYEPPDLAHADYLVLARERAVRAVQEAGLVSAIPRRQASLGDLLGSDKEATPAQQWAAAVPLPSDGPVLAIIEDVTGSGKTEAAQMLVSRLIAAGRATGAYWALPTQATANAMFQRQRRALELLFANDGPTPSLVLAHGQASLHPGFRRTILGNDAAAEVQEQSDTEASSASCAAWLAHDRRLALLADLGAGTVDQSLLSILPVRFNTMRLFGLTDKVLVLDEIHAYDAYMYEEISALLRFAAALGGSVILLSATLPLQQRARLTEAWRAGARLATTRASGGEGSGQEAAYPFVSLVGRDGTSHAQAISVAKRSERTTPVKFVRDEAAALNVVLQAARRGGAVAWVRNTVRSCLQAADYARAAGLDPIVFHAGMAQCDRQRIEAEVLRRLGPPHESAAEDRRGVMVVATQVIEQSLDIDFDTMVTDLAPVDLVLQRAGRLWRHGERNAQRPEGATETLTILAPLNRTESPGEWVKSLPRGDGRVYRPDVLWRTQGVLEEIGQLAVPSGVRELIERVYDEERAEAIPEDLQAAARRAEGDARAAGAIGRQSVLEITKGYNGFHIGWSDESRVSTRLGPETVTLRLGRLAEDGSVLPWCEDAERSEAERWRLSEVRVRNDQVPYDAVPQNVTSAAVQVVREQWGKFDRDCVLVPLSLGDSGFLASLHSPSWHRTIGLAYSSARGLDMGERSQSSPRNSQ